VSSPDDVRWDYQNSLTPLKRFLFPPSDPMLRWTQTNGRPSAVEPVYDDKERVFLAVRPCDVSAVLILDRSFGRDPEDVQYTRRRQRSALIALACTEPGPNCFCVCANAGPFLDQGYDVQLTRLAHGYLVEVGTEKGASLLSGCESLFDPAPAAALDARQRLAREAENQFGEDKAYFAAALRQVTFNRVSDDLWRGMGELCLGCGGCAFVCPTCHCFATADCTDSGGGCRLRLWDSCLYEAYTLEASGHNPRAERGQRVKARFFHKLSYQFAQKLGAHGCVGCGRCVTACLGSNDMPAVTARIRRGAL
jgi:formate hydrogenlyase subunit 6/NADH:ubiquinone oxidoreductase subunit I